VHFRLDSIFGATSNSHMGLVGNYTAGGRGLRVYSRVVSLTRSSDFRHYLFYEPGYLKLHLPGYPDPVLNSILVSK